MDITQLKILYEQLADDIKFLIYRSVIYYDKKYKKRPHLKKKDRIYLFRKNIKIQKLNNKLDHVKLGPFKIKKKISFINYKFELF